jgi:hypothetical protein
VELGDLARLPLVPDGIADLPEVLSRGSLFVRQLPPGAPSEIAHTSRIRPEGTGTKMHAPCLGA